MGYRRTPGAQVLMNYRSIASLTALGLASAAFSQLKVVTTTADLASVAQAIGGSKVSASSIVTGARDAHRIEAKPSYMSRVAQANLFIAIGLELEVGYERPILDGSGNRRVAVGASGHMYAGDYAYILEKPSGAVSRAQGDIHPYGNPHIWLDPWNERLVAIAIANKLSELDTKNQSSYKAGLETFLDRLDSGMFGAKLVKRFGGQKLWEWQRGGVLGQELRRAGAWDDLGGWTAQMVPLAGRKVYTYHRSLSYFAARFGIDVVNQLEPKPGIDPTPGHLASLIQGGQGIKAIIQENFYDTKAANTVAGRIGAKVVLVPQNVGADPAAKDYVSFMDVFVSRVAAALR
jgi:zinc/manganese transport system substrate-binding protein